MRKGFGIKKQVSLFLVAVLLISGTTACGKKKEKNSPAQTEVVKEDKEDKNKNLIPEASSTFDQSTGKWATYFNGGSATLNNKKQMMVLDITSVGTLDYAVQDYLDGFALDQGCKYTFSFDATSDVPRTIQWRIQINGGDYHPYVSDNVKIGPETTHIEKTFEMTESSDPAPRLCLNCGKFDGDGDLGKHSISFDNFVLTLADESGKVAQKEAAKLPDINVDQVGYLPDMEKTAVVRGKKPGGKAFRVIDTKTKKTVLKGKTGKAVKNASSDETTAIADFSKLKKDGTYQIKIKGIGTSDAFKVGKDVYRDLTDKALKMLYLQRCGEDLPKDYAGDFAHPACHTGEATVYGTSEKRTVTGGWHDAGDYGRYVVSGAMTVEDLLLSYEWNPSLWKDDSGIPESGNGVPDILDEARYELDWMLKMQDPASGGVYHKVTCKNFPEFVMPEKETEDLFLAPISQTATADFAAVMARAAMVYEKIDPDFSRTALAASKKAGDFCLGQGKDLKHYKNPEDIVTGEYPDNVPKDEVFWAMAELYRSTGEDRYLTELKTFDIDEIRYGFGWADMGWYGLYAYLEAGKDDSLRDTFLSILKDRLEKVTDLKDTDAYSASCGEVYPWGSNLTMAENGMLYIMADKLGVSTGDSEMDAASQLHYLLGENANSTCFVTGFGTLSPLNTHHRPSQALGKTMEGMLVGGPDSNLEDPYAKATLKDAPPAKCYADNAQGFSLNEVTIYWNSALVCLLSGIQAGK